MNEAPATRVDEFTRVGLGNFALGLVHTSKLDLAWWQKVNSWDGLIADGDLTLGGTNVDATEARKVLEESSIWCTHGQFHLWQLWEDTKVPYSSLLHHQALSRVDCTSQISSYHICLI